jgi:hypothetical protein
MYGDNNSNNANQALQALSSSVMQLEKLKVDMPI